MKNVFALSMSIIFIVILIIIMILTIFYTSLENKENWIYDREITNSWLNETDNENNLGYQYQIRVFKYDNEYPKRIRLYGSPVYEEPEWELLKKGTLYEDGEIKWNR